MADDVEKPDVEVSDRERLLATAHQVVMGDRDQSYGSPTKSFQNIANYWSVYLGKEISTVDVALMLDLMKTSRLQTGGADQADTWVDKAGYAACGYEVRNA